MCFTVHIIFTNFDNYSPDLGRDTCLAPEGFKRSFSGPWPKKVVHHCTKATSQSASPSKHYVSKMSYTIEKSSKGECTLHISLCSSFPGFLNIPVNFCLGTHIDTYGITFFLFVNQFSYCFRTIHVLVDLGSKMVFSFLAFCTCTQELETAFPMSVQYTLPIN